MKKATLLLIVLLLAAIYYIMQLRTANESLTTQNEQYLDSLGKLSPLVIPDGFQPGTPISNDSAAIVSNLFYELYKIKADSIYGGFFSTEVLKDLLNNNSEANALYYRIGIDTTGNIVNSEETRRPKALFIILQSAHVDVTDDVDHPYDVTWYSDKYYIPMPWCPPNCGSTPISGSDTNQ